MSKFGQPPSKFTPSFGSGGKQDPTDEGETQCIETLSTVKVNVDLSGGPQHSITYGRGEYGFFNDTGPDFTQLRALDIYQGAFSIKRFGKEDLPGEAGRVEMKVLGPCDTGYKGGSDCPNIEGCCVNNSYAQDGATTLTLDYTFRKYKNDLGKGRLQGLVGDIVATSNGSLIFDLCDSAKVAELTKIYNDDFVKYMQEEKGKPQKINYQLEMKLELISINSRIKCFTKKVDETEEEFLKRKEAWCGGRVDGKEMWDVTKDRCNIGGFLGKAGDLGGAAEDICRQMTGMEDTTIGPLGVIRMGKSMPPPATKKKVTNQNEIEYYIHEGKDTDWPEIGGITDNGSWNDAIATEEFKGHGGLLNFKGKEYLGSRQLLLDIIGGIIGDPVKKICDFHTKTAMQVLDEMGEEGKELMCFAFHFKRERDGIVGAFAGLPKGYDSFTIGMPKCLQLVKNVVT